ncbi:MAG TPA: ABC transporter substrate-binding protein [Calditrichia bacterium]|nr:ABC transporter substrate-binding protein [Calditrichia bacterium]
MMRIHLFLIAALLLLASCGQEKGADNMTGKSWAEIESMARGTTVNLMMWGGDPFINAYMKNYVVPALQKEHGVTLNIVEGQGSRVVRLVMTELEAGRSESEIDMAWINGETFYQLRQINALYGPFTDRLPNGTYIDFENPFISTDFQQPVNGMECPWGNVQLAIIYDNERVPEPPRTMAALSDWVKANPGRFTLTTDFTGMTLLKSFLIDLAGGKNALAGPFDPQKYQRLSGELWAYLNANKPYFWKEGKTFPDAIAQMHQMFANGEIDFTMSNNDGEVDNKVVLGVFPNTARSYVFDAGTIQNSHYMGIMAHGANKAGAMVVCNFLISPAAQLEKMNPEVWGDGTILAVERLPEPWPEKFRTIPGRRYALKRNEIKDKALAEIAPEYMIRLYEDFRREVIEK